jgi:hypothetical protein
VAGRAGNRERGPEKEHIGSERWRRRRRGRGQDDEGTWIWRDRRKEAKVSEGGGVKKGSNAQGGVDSDRRSEMRGGGRLVRGESQAVNTWFIVRRIFHRQFSSGFRMISRGFQCDACRLECKESQVGAQETVRGWI